VAKAVNRLLRRHGALWGDRYHARQLETPSEVRRALVFVLQNWKKHVPGARGLDPRSSAAWFDGWQTPPPPSRERRRCGPRAPSSRESAGGATGGSIPRSILGGCSASAMNALD
jgi:hypothetical protein